MRLGSAGLAVFLLVAWLMSPALAGAGASHHHAGTFVFLQRHPQAMQEAAAGCMLGTKDRAAALFDGIFASGPVDPIDFCITALSASLQRGGLEALLTRYGTPGTSPQESGIAFALGFRGGFLVPDTYSAYQPADAALLQRLTEDCLALRGTRKDCLIAGGLQGAAERQFAVETPELRQMELRYTRKNP